MPSTESFIHPTAIVEPEASLAADVRIGPYSVVHDGVEIGAGTIVASHCVLGYSNQRSSTQTLTIGPDSLIRSHSTIYRGSVVGSGFESGHHTTIRESSMIGIGTRIGSYTDVQGSTTIGDYARIHSQVFVSKGTSLEDFVWVFPRVMFLDDPHPPSDGFNSGARVGRYASIGANATILPGVSVGEDSFVAAGSVVTNDVPTGRYVVGSPARDRGAAQEIMLKDGSGPAYPWRRHFHRDYPSAVVSGWVENSD
jgi:acetyltransferase-like isoleucine patch superfamily enzyme